MCVCFSRRWLRNSARTEQVYHSISHWHSSSVAMIETVRGRHCLCFELNLLSMLGKTSAAWGSEDLRLPAIEKQILGTSLVSMKHETQTTWWTAIEIFFLKWSYYFTLTCSQGQAILHSRWLKCPFELRKYIDVYWLKYSICLSWRKAADIPEKEAYMLM